MPNQLLKCLESATLHYKNRYGLTRDLLVEFNSDTPNGRVKLIDAQSEYVEEGVGNIDSIVKQFDRGESSVEQS